MDELKFVGPRLRAARHNRGWTLDELANRAQMSVSTLSRLESGKRQASLELLVPLTSQLGIRVDDLIAHNIPDPRVKRQSFTREGLIVTPLSPLGTAFNTYMITYPPQDSIPELKVHDGYEWIYVLSGSLRLVLGDQEYALAKGEAAEFDTRTPHAIFASGKRSADVIIIFSGEGSEHNVK